MNNKTYMCILRSKSGSCEKPSPSEMELMYAKYQDWQEKFADNILALPYYKKKQDNSTKIK